MATAKKKTRARKPKNNTTPGEKLLNAVKITVRGSTHVTGDTKKVAFYEPQTFTLPPTLTYPEGKNRRVETNPETGATKTIVTPKIVSFPAELAGLGYIRKYLLPPKLKELYPEFNGIRICEISNRENVLVPESELLEHQIGSVNVSEMNEGQLLLVLAFYDLNVSLDQYYDLADKKIAVQQALEKAGVKKHTGETVQATTPRVDRAGEGDVEDVPSEWMEVDDDDEALGDILG